MRYHHTKSKGDLGAIKAMADMTAKGWSVLAGLSEHQALDFLEIPSTVRGVSAGETSGLVGWGWVRQSAVSRAA